MVKLQEYKGRYFLIIPKVLVKSKKWIKGVEFAPAFNEDGDIVLKEIK